MTSQGLSIVEDTVDELCDDIVEDIDNDRG